LACGKENRGIRRSHRDDISAFPPELIRKGRFDELFLVDLPNVAARVEILRIHAQRRDCSSNLRNSKLLLKVVQISQGSEIEQAVVSALYAAHARKDRVSAADVLNEIHATRPLATVMAERIGALREWARVRTVPAE
jgi:ATP-dependent 26S proteasome regulatory subunit